MPTQSGDRHVGNQAWGLKYQKHVKKVALGVWEDGLQAKRRDSHILKRRKQTGARAKTSPKFYQMTPALSLEIGNVSQTYRSLKARWGNGQWPRSRTCTVNDCNTTNGRKALGVDKNRLGRSSEAEKALTILDGEEGGWTNESTVWRLLGSAGGQ